MELIAAIETLKALKKYTEICIITDSNYVKKGITNGSLLGKKIIGKLHLKKK